MDPVPSLPSYLSNRPVFVREGGGEGGREREKEGGRRREGGRGREGERERRWIKGLKEENYIHVHYIITCTVYILCPN